MTHYYPSPICTVAVLIKLGVALQMLFSSVLDNYVKCFSILKPLNKYVSTLTLNDALHINTETYGGSITTGCAC